MRFDARTWFLTFSLLAMLSALLAYSAHWFWMLPAIFFVLVASKFGDDGGMA